MLEDQRGQGMSFKQRLNQAKARNDRAGDETAKLEVKMHDYDDGDGDVR